MTDAEIAIERLTAWVRDYGDSKPKEFVADVSVLLLIAREAIEMSRQASSLQKPLEDVLLSDQFMKKFADAFVNTPLPSAIQAFTPYIQ